MIDTPSGYVPVHLLREGMAIWTVDAQGSRVLATIAETPKTPTRPGFKVVGIRLEDGRQLMASAGHPLPDGRSLGQLRVGDTLDGSRVSASEEIAYEGRFTYVILPSGEAGLYWADRILVGSSLKRSG